MLAGLATATGNEDLEKASYYLRLSGLCYKQGLAEVDYIMQNQPVSREVFSTKLARIAGLLRRVAEYERKAGESLGKGAKAFD